MSFNATKNPQQISTMFTEVESIVDYIRKSEGAKVVKSKNEIREGYYAVLEDPHKNTFGIWESKEQIYLLKAPY